MLLFQRLCSPWTQLSHPERPVACPLTPLAMPCRARVLSLCFQSCVPRGGHTVCNLGGPLVLAQALASLGLLGPWLPHSSLPHPTLILEMTPRGTPGAGTHGAGRESVGGDSVQMAWAVSGWKGRAPTQCVERTRPLRARAALERGQAGFQREPQAELNTHSKHWAHRPHT